MCITEWIFSFRYKATKPNQWTWKMRVNVSVYICNMCMRGRESVIAWIRSFSAKCLPLQIFLYNKPMHSVYLIYCEKLDVSVWYRKTKRRRTLCVNPYIQDVRKTRTQSAFEACLQFKWTSGYYLLKIIFPHNSRTDTVLRMHSDSMRIYIYAFGRLLGTIIESLS